MSAWVIVTRPADVRAAVAAAVPAGPVTILAVGTRELADLAAVAGADGVSWLALEAGQAVESCAAQVADLVAEARPRLLVTGTDPAARTLAGAAAARLGAALVVGVVAVHTDGEVLVVERAAVGGAVIETLASPGPVSVVVTPAPAADDEGPSSAAVSVQELSATGSGVVRVLRREPLAAAGGVRDAATVVAVGRGLRARTDLGLIEGLAAALDGELACSMPVADDLGWVAKDRYVGRSGQHISPRLYLAVGISGAPQHLEGIRGAKVVAAINSDPGAPIFRTVDYGVVGDLYEVVPAVLAALGR